MGICVLAMRVVSRVEMADVIKQHPHIISDLFQIPLEMVKKNIESYLSNSDTETLNWMYSEIQELISITNNYETPRF